VKPSKVVVLLVGLPGLSFAQICSDLEGDAERLACYDAQNSVSSTIPEEAPDSTTQQAPPVEVETPMPERKAEVRPADDQARIAVAAEAPEDFGRQEPFDARKEYIEASIVEVTTPGGVNHFRLDNGQVWRENGYSNKRYREGRKVTITEGVLSSYDLKIEGYSRIIKVKRIR
jgi:hypothetical protein